MERIKHFSLLKKTIKSDRNRYSKKERDVTLLRIYRSIFTDLKKPIFIIGAPRSGTTILGKCIGQINKVSYHFEPVYTKFISHYIYKEKISNNYAKILYKFIYKLLLKIYIDGDLTFVEKTPRNAFIIPFLIETFPDAKFIHIIRDGRDAALSYSKKPWLQMDSKNSDKKEPGGFKYGPYPRFWVEENRYNEFETTTDIHRCIWGWKRFVEVGLKDTEQLDNSKLLEIRYEELVENSKEQARKILSFIGGHNEDEEVNFFKAIDQIHDNSMGNWKKEINNEDLELIHKEAGQLLNELGYK